MTTRAPVFESSCVPELDDCTMTRQDPDRIHKVRLRPLWIHRVKELAEVVPKAGRAPRKRGTRCAGPFQPSARPKKRSPVTGCLRDAELGRSPREK